MLRTCSLPLYNAEYVLSFYRIHRVMRLADIPQQSNITFASVHDSYWTHAATVEGMSELIRNTFIHLHSSDLIGELRAEVSYLSPPRSHCRRLTTSLSTDTASTASP